MAITVRDCLDHPVFKDAKVIGGISGFTNNLDGSVMRLAKYFKNK